MRIIKILSFVGLLATLIPFSSNAQIKNNNDVFEELPEHLMFQVKQLDQFIARFNSNENSEGIRINVSNTSLEDRERLLASLFNLEMLDNPSFKGKAIQFIKEVTGSKITNLSFYDKSYYATIDCQVLYKNKREQLTLTLVVEGSPNNGAQWVIKGASAEFLNTKNSSGAKNVVARRIIPPTNHEVNFISLLEIFNKEQDLNNYLSESHGPNQLDVLNSLLKNGDIKMLSTTIPTYHFLQIPGWIFTVEFFNRATKNSGLLISNLTKVEQPEINRYKIEKLFILQ